tara:strand:+ start:12109 stop:12564 length:456 start_codon:yes stop_codon:yes gene_type:complete
MGLSRLHYGLLVGSLMAGWLLVLLATHAVDVHGHQPAENTHLYACANTMPTDVPPVGVTLCDASPTSELELRRDSDNLQSRDGALVLEVLEMGIASEGGLQPRDLIYRVGGVDVKSSASAADRLSQINPVSDTIVNFLRQGRPYRVKLRKN